MRAMEDRRSAGVLLHPTSLPSPFGIGDLGPSAFAYLEWLKDAGVRWWQVLPLHPPGPGDSPYSAISTFAGNELLISPALLVEDGLLSEEDLADPPAFSDQQVDFAEVAPFKLGLLQSAYRRFRSNRPTELVEELSASRETHGEWLG